MTRGKAVALQQSELIPLLKALDTPDLYGFEYISIHAPGQFDPGRECSLRDRLLQ
jgi:hypothetical protein